ncbi:hypothetical protein GCM10023206_31570 [Acinetobacter puyangensis]|uniref:YD repeat-containing protein n=1 Tax=Acinetobacter puyangensis TaxID=1096779 RepID=A0A240E2S3_9GAMM|nr:hypothetical protein [Acinetobacter puyangensis]SNX43077.1 hypothetical protein SAMN05421731_101111 [Acinetobacter puyangensis]
MQKIITFAVALLACSFSLVQAATTPNGDAVSQAYAISSALKTQEHIPGISLIGGQITHSQPVIRSGKLPYIISYVGSVRNSLSASNDYFDQFLTTGGWTDNYHNSIRFYSYNGSATIGYYAIRLPGSRQEVWLRNTGRSVCSGGVQRAFSSDVLGNLVYATAANIVWSCTTHGYQFSENTGGGITINYRGTIYTTTNYSVTQSGTKYYRIAQVNQPLGKKLNFSYDNNLNMLSVMEEHNNKLSFLRNYNTPNQTIADKRLVTGVELTMAGSSVKQTASLSYESYNSQDANGQSGSIFYPVTVTSDAYGKTTFTYKPIKQWGIDGYLKSKGITVSNSNAAILSSIKNAANITQREWLVSQNYLNYDSNTKTYGTARVTLQVRSPVDASYASDYTVNYDDNNRTVDVNIRPDGMSTGTVYYRITPKPVYKTSIDGTTYYDDGESEISITGGSFPALTIGGGYPQKIRYTKLV